MTSTLPIVRARGSWGHMGRTLGKTLAPLIHRHLNAWLGHVTDETGCERQAAIEAAVAFAEPVRNHAPFLWEELEGMASGCGLAMKEMLVLQARTEVLRLNQKRPATTAAECTTFAVGSSRTAHGHVYFGHNVDLPPLLEPYGVIVQHEPDEAPATLMYTAAGLLGQNGLNEAGVGICANFIDDPQGWGVGFPRYLLSRLALRGETTATAMENVLQPPRAASRNLLIADAHGDLVDVELLIEAVGVLRAENDLLIHANHLEAERFEGLETPEEDSLQRRRQLQTLFNGIDSVRLGDLERFFASHANGENSICVHAREGSNWKMIVSVIGDLTARVLRVAKGNPCSSPFTTIGLGASRTQILLDE